MIGTRYLTCYCRMARRHLHGSLCKVTTCLLSNKVVTTSSQSIGCDFGEVAQHAVQIYHWGQLVKVYVGQSKGGRATDPEDYPAEPSEYTTRVLVRIKLSAAELKRAVSNSQGDSWTAYSHGTKSGRYQVAPS